MTDEEKLDLEGLLLPKRYHGCTWEKFQWPGDSTLPEVVVHQIGLLRDWTGEGDDWMAFLTGPAGTGKTFMAVATALRWITSRGYGCRFLVCSDWLQEIKSGFHDNTAQRALHRAKKAKLLIMDDLGAEMASEWVRDVVYSVINHRYNEILPTLVTSNLSLNEISQNYHDRLASRLASGLVVNTTRLPDRRVSQ